MKVGFLVQNNYVAVNTARVARFARDRGYELMDVSVTPQLNLNTLRIEQKRFDSIFAYGSVRFIDYHCRFCSAVNPYLWISSAIYGCSTWLERFGSDCLNADGETVTIANLTNQIDQQVFVRPAATHKTFNGSVFDKNTWSEHLSSRSLDPNLTVLVAMPKRIQSEYRCWLVDGQLVAASSYMTQGKRVTARGCTAEVRNAVERWASMWLPEPTITIDVAVTSEGPKIIEFNPIHSAGWYEADVESVLERVVTYPKLNRMRVDDDG